MISGWMFALFAAILWGLNGVLVRKGLEKTDAISGTFFIVFISIIYLLLLAIFDQSLFKIGSINMQNLVFLSIAGFLQYFLGRMFTYTSINVIGSSRAYTATSTRIVFSSLFGIILLGERVHYLIIFGIILMVFGLSLLMRDKLEVKGFHLAISGGFFFGLASIFIKKGLLESVVLSNLISGMSAIPFLAVVAFTKGRLKLNKFLFAAGTTLFLGTFFYYKALSLAPVIVAVPISNLYPFFTTVFSYLLIQRLEGITFRTLLGVFLVIIGGVAVILGDYK